MSTSFTIDGYVGTLHWATTLDGFDSVVTLFNYYGYAFRNKKPQDTDAEVIARFFNEQGEELPPFETHISTGGSLHLSVQKTHPGFQGLVSVQMIPAGKMGRIRAKAGTPQLPIATSFFMLYKKDSTYSDFSHELFPVREKPEAKLAEWATITYFAEIIKPGFIVMNNRPLRSGQEFGSKVEVRLLDLSSRPLTEPFLFSLPPGGSKRLLLGEAFPDFQAKSNSAILSVKGNNIEQPLSLHLHPSGDFNIHHF